MRLVRITALLAVSASVSSFTACDDPRLGMTFAGYTQLSPPSNLFVPGAVVVVTFDPQKRAEMKLVCGPRASLGSSYLPRVSDTVSSALKLTKSQRFELEADAIDRFRSRTSVEDIDSVSVSFTNARVLEADDSEIFRLMKNRSDDCWNAVIAREASGAAPTMVSSAFIADVTYEVGFKRTAGVEKRVIEDKMGEIAVKLGGGHTEVSDHSIKAVNLVVGVKTDRFYMGITRNLEPSSSEAADRSGIDEIAPTVVEANGDADAPLISPAGGWVNPVRGL